MSWEARHCNGDWLNTVGDLPFETISLSRERNNVAGNTLRRQKELKGSEWQMGKEVIWLLRAGKTEITIVEEKTLKSRDMIEAFKMLKRIVKVNTDKLCQQ